MGTVLVIFSNEAYRREKTRRNAVLTVFTIPFYVLVAIRVADTGTSSDSLRVTSLWKRVSFFKRD